MTSPHFSSPAIALVDDDHHSARFMTRILAAFDGPHVTLFDNPERAFAELQAPGTDPMFSGRSLVLVDLKYSSTATRDFIARLTKAAPQLLVAAMAPSLDRDTRNCLLDAGAVAVFERHADHNLYMKEAASIVSYWVRAQRLDAVGA